ncbi:MAG: hypothetical protein F2836_05600, partial [Actinobacteria bacterium]|nr:hypothetical protein [Actinomycetota bacterium]
MITDMNRDLGRWAESNEIAWALLEDKEGKALIRRAQAADGSDNADETAWELVDSWGQRLASQKNSFSGKFQQTICEPSRFWSDEAGTPPDDGEARTFILTWHPERYVVSDSLYKQYVEEVARDGHGAFTTWSTGNRTSGIVPGDYFYLFRQKSERGIVAWGQFTSSIFQDANWTGEGKPANYAETHTTVWLPLEDRLTIETLIDEIPEFSWNRLQGSGILLNLEVEEALSEAWFEHCYDFDNPPDDDEDPDDFGQSPDEVEADVDDETFPVEAVKQVLVNRYERNPQAREACIAKFGYDCSVCGFNFEATYGDIGEEYIHGHHLVE